VRDTPADATAYAHRDRDVYAACLCLWGDPTGDPEPHLAWLDSLYSSLRPHGSGAYVNFLDDEGELRIRDAYPTATYARLAAVKRQYDPDNVFRLNQNVRPSA